VDLGDDGGGVVKLEKLEFLLLQIYSFSLVQHTLVSRIPGVDLNIDMNFVPLLLIFFNSSYTFSGGHVVKTSIGMNLLPYCPHQSTLLQIGSLIALT
jgi:hypothetical protein